MPILWTHHQYYKLFVSGYRPRIKNENILKILKCLQIFFASKIFTILYFILIKAVCRLINVFIYIVKRIVFLLFNSFLKESTTHLNYFPCDYVLLFFSTLPFWKNVKNEETLMACSYRHFSFPCISFCVEPAKDWITFPSTFPSQSTKYVLTYYFHFNKLYRIEILIQRFEDWRMDNTFFYLLRQKS